MPSPTVLDFDLLLAPISEAMPAGIELKEDGSLRGLYYEVKDARDLARSLERESIQYQMRSEDERADMKPPALPNWQQVIKLSQDVLAKHSKDLWVCAWLVEGLCRKQGFAGLRDGFRLARELVERYWDAIHPRPDEDGIATTVAQFAGLNGEGGEGALLQPIDAIPITNAKEVGYFTGRDYKHASTSKSGDATGLSLDLIKAAADKTEPQLAQQLIEDVTLAKDEFSRLTIAFDDRLTAAGAAAVPSSQIKVALEESLERLESLYRKGKSGGADGDANNGEDPATNLTTTGSKATMTQSGRVATRDDAFRLLLQVAEFFRRTEPHSPVSYALEQAVRWGRMPLPELLMDLISDSNVREEMFRRTGIPRQESDS